MASQLLGPQTTHPCILFGYKSKFLWPIMVTFNSNLSQIKVPFRTVPSPWLMWEGPPWLYAAPSAGSPDTKGMSAGRPSCLLLRWPSSCYQADLSCCCCWFFASISKLSSWTRDQWFSARSNYWGPPPCGLSNYPLLPSIWIIEASSLKN